MTDAVPAHPAPLHTAVVVDAGLGPYVEIAHAGRHALIVDEPESVGGRDLGPTPYALLLMALGTCTAITVRMYAARKTWPLVKVTVRLGHSRSHHGDCEEVGQAAAKLERIEVSLAFEGPLDPAQRARLAEIAEQCPVHKALGAGMRIVTTLAG